MAEKMDKPRKASSFNITKNHLINYRFYVATIERKQERIDQLSAQAEGIRATDYSRDRVQTSPENMIEKMISEKMKIEDDLRKAKALVADIDRAMNELDQDTKTILELKYIALLSQFNSWVKVARIVGYEERQCRRKADYGIEKISVVIFGVE